jgi:DNA polymerase-3 subunit gamma/tau
MGEYIVTARKYRPMRFEDVTGQGPITTTLRNAMATKRIAHAYLFGGPRGVGKTTTARLLAKAVNCSSPVDQNPDNTCESCREITEGRSFDVLEIDGASNRGVEEIRNLRESVRYAPARGAYKVYIIDEVHMLTKEAFNALLKTLEEPPPHVLFIFATTEVNKVPATILSRCQRFDFRRIRTEEIAANLRAIATAEGLAIDEDALHLIARRGDGSLRDAQSVFDQVVALCGAAVTRAKIVEALNLVDQEVYFSMTDLIRAGDTKGGLALVDDIMTGGHDLREFLSGLTEHFRNLLVAKTTKSTLLIEAADVYRQRYAAEAEFFDVSDLLRLQRLVSLTDSALRWTTQPRFRLEADVVQMIALPRAKDVSELLERLDELLGRQEGGGHPPGVPSPSAGERPAATLRSVPSAAPHPSPPVAQHTSGSASQHPPAPRPGAGISAGEVSSRWSEFLGEVRTRKISLWPALENASLLGVEQGIVRLGVADDFQASLILKSKEFLGDVFQKILNVRLGVKPEVAGGPQGGPKVPATNGADAGARGEEHPVLAAMKRELGAEPI